MEHIEGQNNVVADVLSRLEFDEPNREADPITPVLNVAERSTNRQESQPDTIPRWHDRIRPQKENTVIAKVLKWRATGEWPSFEAIRQLGYKIQTFWHKYHELVVKEGLL